MSRLEQTKLVVPISMLVVFVAAGGASAAKKGPGGSAPVVEKAAAPKGPAKPTGPDLQWEKLRQQVDTKAAALRQQLIQDLKRLLEVGVKKEEEPDIYFRLAENYSEMSKGHHAVAMGHDCDKDKVKKGDPAAVQCDKQKQAELQKAKAAQQEAFGYYQKILKDFPDYPRYDAVLFFLGYGFWENQEQTKALKIYRELVTRFPQSEYLPEVFLAFGEHYFDQGEMDKADKAYTKVTEYPESKIYGYALYKKGWVFYNLGEWERALEEFKRAIAYSTNPQGQEDPNRIALRREALRDYVLTYSQTGDPTHAKEDFTAVAGPDNYLKMMETLQDLLISQGKDLDAIKLGKMLQKEYGNSVKVAKVQVQIVEAAQRLNNKALVLKETKTAIDMMPELPGYAQTEDDKKEVPRVTGQMEKSFGLIAKMFHDECNRAKAAATCESATKMYGLFLEGFPASKESYEVRFYYAELLYDQKKYEVAADNYVKVVEQNPAGSFSQDAAYNSILAYDQIIKADMAAKTKVKKTKDSQKKEIGAVYQKLMTACELYLKHFPKGENGVTVQFKIARIYYHHNHFDQANQWFARIALENPAHELAEVAMNLYLDSFNLAKDWKSLNETARKFRKNPQLMANNPKRIETMDRLIQESSFKMVEPVEKAKKHSEAAEMYVAFFKEFPNSKLAPTALYNAAVNYQLGGEPGSAIETRAILIQKFPDSPLLKDAVYANAQALENSGDFERGAEAYEAFAAKYPKEAKAADGLSNAGTYRSALGQHDAALEDRKQYIALFGKKDPKEKCEFMFDIAVLYEKKKDTAAADKAYNEYIKTCRNHDADKALVTQVKLANYKNTPGNWKTVQKLYEEVLKEHDRQVKKGKTLTTGAVAAAEAKFHLARPTMEKFEAVQFTEKIVNTPKLLKKTYEEKNKMLGEVINVYTEVVKLGQGEWAVAALFEIGAALFSFQKTLNEAPIPKNLTETQKEIYRMDLQEMTDPIVQKGVAGFQACLEKSSELDVYTDWTLKCAEKLQALRPERYPPPIERFASAEFAFELSEPKPLITTLVVAEKKEEEKVESVKMEETESDVAEQAEEAEEKLQSQKKAPSKAPKSP